MSTKKLESVIYKELEKVNDRIDIKIIRGRPYGEDARRHHDLLKQLYRLRKERSLQNSRNYYGNGSSITSRVWGGIV